MNPTDATRSYKNMKQLITDYNWDDGFQLPKQILSDDQCDLALALEVFYLGDGYAYFQTYPHNIGGSKGWFCFISKLYEDIQNGIYKKSNRHYIIPLSKVQRYQLRKNNIPETFLSDI